MNSLSICLSGIILNSSFLDDSFFWLENSCLTLYFLSVLEYTIPLLSILWSFCWEIHWQSYRNSLLYVRSIFCNCFQDSLCDFWHIDYNVSWYISLWIFPNKSFLTLLNCISICFRFGGLSTIICSYRFSVLWSLPPLVLP